MSSTTEVVEVPRELLDDKIVTRTQSAVDTKSDRRYAKYVLIVLALVSFLNFYDRAIMGVLVEDIKADLNLSDTDMGFLGGAAFAVFYSTFGMALGRLADVWNRTKLISLGLGFWSLMTTFSGLAQGMRSLAVCRFGVGVGESCASPAALSLIYDYFPPKVRTRAVAIFNCGGAIGGGLGIYASGMLLDYWNNAWPDSSFAPFGLAGWQAAFIIAGIPGLLMTLWVYTLREPVRGQNEGIANKPHATPFRESISVLLSMIPIINFWIFSKNTNGKKAIATNAVIALIIITAVHSLILITNDRLQWITIGVGTYAAVSWAQGIAIRDPVIFSLIFRCKALLYFMLGMTMLMFMMYALFWNIPYFQRNYGVSASEVGSILGGLGSVFGVIGILAGGFLADKLSARTVKGKLYVALAGMVVSIFCYFVLFTVNQLHIAYAAALLLGLAFSVIVAPSLSTLNDLVIPRGRATISALYIMTITLSGGALSPYIVGKISDAIVATGIDGGEALRQGMLWIITAPIIGIVFVILAIRNIEADQASLLKRARASGENI